METLNSPFFRHNGTAQNSKPFGQKLRLLRILSLAYEGKEHVNNFSIHCTKSIPQAFGGNGNPTKGANFTLLLHAGLSIRSRIFPAGY